MSISLMTDVWKLNLQAPRKMVLLALADNANDEGTQCFPSVATIVEKCSMSERSVFGHLSELEKANLIRRQERPGRSSNYFLNVEEIRAQVLANKLKKEEAKNKRLMGNSQKNKEAATDLTPAEFAGVPANPHDINTPAESAGVQNLHLPLQNLQDTPADSAPITISEPFLSHHNNLEVTEEALGSGCGGDSDNLLVSLYWPKCSEEEQDALMGLLAALPTDKHQILLDEVEGARQAGVIRTGVVSYAGGLVRALISGTFTVGHGASVAAKRRQQAAQVQAVRTIPQPVITEEDLNKGQRFLDRLRPANVA